VRFSPSSLEPSLTSFDHADDTFEVISQQHEVGKIGEQIHGPDVG
jgi:hypothetical protein